MTDVRRTATRSAGRSLAHRWRQAGGAAAAVAAAALLVPSAALAATGGAGAAGQPAAATPGALLAWGNGKSLGTGDSTNSDVIPPDSLLPIPSLKDKFVTQLQGGCNTAVALTSTGDVLTWGDGGSGELGNGTNSFTAAPVPVSFPGTPKITSVAAGCTYILALTADGNVLAWGDNGAGELGNGQPGKNQNRPVPVEFPNGVRVTAISAGLNFAMALTSTGQLYAWGDDETGELGDGGGHQLRGRPVLVHLPRNVRATSVSAGGDHTLAMTNAGLVSWGRNDHGQLGNGTHRQLSTPFPVFLPRGTHVTAISAGDGHSLVLVGNGSGMLAWGNNLVGELGDGTTTDRTHPVAVKLHLNPGAKVTSINAGEGFSMALTSDQQVLTWGVNSRGQLGINSTADSSVPVAAHLPPVPVVGGPPKPASVLAIGTGSTSNNGYAIIPLNGL